MSRIHVQAERVFVATPQDVYAVLSDYKGKHPQILTPNFLDYTVEKGGQGEGTVVRFRLQAAGRERPYRLRVDEPVKGQVLTESDTNSSLVTTWAVLPMNQGEQTKVRLTTEWEGSGGVGGFFERTFAPLGLHRIYTSILSNIEPLVAGDSTSSATNTGSSVGSSEPSQSSVSSNLGLFFLILGGVLTFAGVASYLRRARR